MQSPRLAPRLAPLVLLASLASVACRDRTETQPSQASAGAPRPAHEANPQARPRDTAPIPAPLDVARPPADAILTASGLYHKLVRAGTGTAHPELDDVIVTEYVGWGVTGVMVSSTRANGEPSMFRLDLDGILPGWKEGIPLMVVGEKRRFWIPEELAFQGAPNQPRGTVVFDIELVSIQPSAGVVAPADVAAPPPDATFTGSGLAYKVLAPGIGTDHPTAASQVEIHFTGWTRDGKMIASSVGRDEAIIVKLDTLEVMRGVAEGLQLMVEGEKRRFWIPETLAYPNDPRSPKGMLVYDIELVGIVSI